MAAEEQGCRAVEIYFLTLGYHCGTRTNELAQLLLIPSEFLSFSKTSCTTLKTVCAGITISILHHLTFNT